MVKFTPAGNRNLRKQHGAFYLHFVLFLVLALGISSEVIRVGVIVEKRNSEDALIDIGKAYENALARYRWDHQNLANQTGPKSLEDLLAFQSSNGKVTRYLRRIYEDPLTGKANWGLIRADDGSIVAIYSKAAGRPIGNFRRGADGDMLIASEKYSEWCFGLDSFSGLDLNLEGRIVQVGCRRNRG